MRNQKLQDKLNQAKSFLVILPSNPTFDKVASGLALFLSLKKRGKDVNIICPTAMLAGFNHLIGIDKVTDRIGNRNLLISFDYVKDAIEKVSYNMDNNKFNLVIEPKEGQPAPDPRKVSYRYSGSNAEAFFLIGVFRFEDLGPVYENLRGFLKDKMVVDIDNYPQKVALTETSFLDPHAGSCSELMTNFLKDYQLPVDQDLATNLFLGLENNTQGFKLRVRPETFEAAAWCLRHGARKEYREVNYPLSPFPNGNRNVEPAPDWFKPKIYKSSTPL